MDKSIVLANVSKLAIELDKTDIKIITMLLTTRIKTTGITTKTYAKEYTELVQVANDIIIRDGLTPTQVPKNILNSVLYAFPEWAKEYYNNLNEPDKVKYLAVCLMPKRLIDPASYTTAPNEMIGLPSNFIEEMVQSSRALMDSSIKKFNFIKDNFPFYFKYLNFKDMTKESKYYSHPDFVDTGKDKYCDSLALQSIVLRIEQYAERPITKANLDVLSKLYNHYHITSENKQILRDSLKKNIPETILKKSRIIVSPIITGTVATPKIDVVKK